MIRKWSGNIPFLSFALISFWKKQFPTEGQKDNFGFFLRVIVEKECVLEEING